MSRAAKIVTLLRWLPHPHARAWALLIEGLARITPCRRRRVCAAHGAIRFELIISIVSALPVALQRTLLSALLCDVRRTGGRGGLESVSVR